MAIRSFPHYAQQESADCGPYCLRMIAKFYGKVYSAEMLRKRCFISREGVSMLGICDAAEPIGFRTVSVQITFRQLAEDALFPCILHRNQNHFIVFLWSGPAQARRKGKLLLLSGKTFISQLIFKFSRTANKRR